MKKTIQVFVGGRVTAEQDKEIQTLLFRRVDRSNLPQDGGPLESSRPGRDEANKIISSLVKLGVPFDMWVKGKDSDAGTTTPDQKIVFRPDQPVQRAYCDAYGEPIGPENDTAVIWINQQWGELPNYFANKFVYDDSGLTYDEMYDRVSDYEREEEFYGHEYPQNEDSRFRQNLFQVLGIEDNPKRHKLFSKAWQDGHSDGLHSVLTHAADLVDLIEDE